VKHVCVCIARSYRLAELTTVDGHGQRVLPFDAEREWWLLLWTVIVILFILWLLGFSFHVGGGVIHLLLVIAVVVLVYNLMTGRR
jgi:hypothetical protein